MQYVRLQVEQCTPRDCGVLMKVLHFGSEHCDVVASVGFCVSGPVVVVESWAFRRLRAHSPA